MSIYVLDRGGFKDPNVMENRDRENVCCSVLARECVCEFKC